MGGCWFYFVGPQTLRIVQICVCRVIDLSLILQVRARETAVEYADACRHQSELGRFNADCMELKAQECAL